MHMIIRLWKWFTIIFMIHFGVPFLFCLNQLTIWDYYFKILFQISIKTSISYIGHNEGATGWLMSKWIRMIRRLFYIPKEEAKTWKDHNWGKEWIWRTLKMSYWTFDPSWNHLHVIYFLSSSFLTSNISPPHISSYFRENVPSIDSRVQKKHQILSHLVCLCFIFQWFEFYWFEAWKPNRINIMFYYDFLLYRRVKFV